MKSDNLQIRVQPKEKEAFENAAEMAGLSLSAWVRERLRGIARRELADLGEPIPFFRETLQEP